MFARTILFLIISTSSGLLAHESKDLIDIECAIYDYKPREHMLIQNFANSKN